MAADSADTQRLLDKIAAGDDRAYERLFDRHRRLLADFVRTRLDSDLRARIDPSDVVQETHIDVLRRMDDYLARRPMPFALWLRKTAQERLIKLREQHIDAGRRSVRREISLPDRSSLDLARQLIGPDPTPSKSLQDVDVAQHVRQALAELSDIDREVLLMRYVEKLGNDEIGAVLGLEPGTVSKRHGRALMKLQKLLADRGIGASDA